LYRFAFAVGTKHDKQKEQIKQIQRYYHFVIQRTKKNGLSLRDKTQGTKKSETRSDTRQSSLFQELACGYAWNKELWFGTHVARIKKRTKKMIK
jgi:hypothetical protein